MSFRWSDSSQYENGVLEFVVEFPESQYEEYKRFGIAWDCYSEDFYNSIATVYKIKNSDLETLFEGEDYSTMVDAETGKWAYVGVIACDRVIPRKESTLGSVVDLSKLRATKPLTSRVFVERFLRDIVRLASIVHYSVTSSENCVMLSFESGYDVGKFLYKFFDETVSGVQLMKALKEDPPVDFWDFTRYCGESALEEACCDFETYSYEDIIEDGGVNGFEPVYWSDETGYCLKYNLFVPEWAEEK